MQEQESGSYDPEGEIGYRIDLVLYDDAGRPLAVLDTKYKEAGVPASDDVAQVVSYATRKASSTAVLVYPVSLDQSKRFAVGAINVKTAGFTLHANLNAAGASFLAQVLPAEVNRFPQPT